MMQHCDLHGCEIDRRGCPWCLIESLEQQLQQAHRAGWEQAKREAMSKSIGRSYNAIAAMEYKEPTK